MSKPRLLVACEFSGIVRDAFITKGWDAWSCDIVPTERPGPHIVNDVRNVLDWGWDMMIAHPVCTHMSYAGLRWFKIQPDRMRLALEDFKLFMAMINAPIPMIAVENTHGFAWKWYRPPDQVVEPCHFGDPYTKATSLWLNQLPPLMATNIIANPNINWSRNFGSHNGHDRSRTFPGIAMAMANQWGNL